MMNQQQVDYVIDTIVIFIMVCLAGIAGLSDTLLFLFPSFVIGRTIAIWTNKKRGDSR